MRILKHQLKRGKNMNEMFYSITVDDLNLKVERNNLGYCFSLTSFGRVDVFIYSTLRESLDMLEYVLTILD